MNDRGIKDEMFLGYFKYISILFLRKLMGINK